MCDRNGVINIVANLQTWFKAFFILIFAYCIRFLTVSSRTISSGLDAVSLATDDAAKSLGANIKIILSRIHFPLLKTSLLTSFLLVFIEAIELAILSDNVSMNTI